MIAANLHIAGDAAAASAVIQALDEGPGLQRPVLVNMGVWPDLPALIARCEAFAVSDGGDGLILTILLRSSGKGALNDQIATAGAWAFTRYAALAWAPRRMRLNMIGIGTGPPADRNPVTRGRSTLPLPAQAASDDDVVRTVHAIAGWPSMTGQFIRLGA